MGPCSSETAKFEILPQSCCKVLMNLKRRTMRRETRARGSVMALFLFLIACERGPSKEERLAEAQSLAQAQQAELREKQLAQEAAERKSLQEKQHAELALAEAKSVKDKMLSCCESLGKAGFEGRSMQHMQALDICELAQREGKTLAEAKASIQTALDGQTLTKQCQVE
jgi:hypothetical protein